MTTFPSYFSRLMAVLVLLAPAAAALADQKADLQERFKRRHAQLEQLKSAGTAGETWDGWIEPVKGGDLDAKAKELVADENADRKLLYKIIAEEEKTTQELVAQRNAQRNYRAARSGYWFKLQSGEWKQKA